MIVRSVGTLIYKIDLSCGYSMSVHFLIHSYVLCNAYQFSQTWLLHTRLHLPCVPIEAQLNPDLQRRTHKSAVWAVLQTKTMCVDLRMINENWVYLKIWIWNVLGMIRTETLNDKVYDIKFANYNSTHAHTNTHNRRIQFTSNWKHLVGYEAYWQCKLWMNFTTTVPNMNGMLISGVFVFPSFQYYVHRFLFRQCLPVIVSLCFITFTSPTIPKPSLRQPSLHFLNNTAFYSYCISQIRKYKVSSRRSFVCLSKSLTTFII